MPSFDAVSEVDHQEVDNAVNQATKEIQQRYDFKGTKTELKLDKNNIHVVSDNETKMKAVIEILQTKAMRRGIDIKSLSVGKIEPAGGQLVKCDVKVLEGIETEKAKKLTAAIKDSKLKVQAQIQDNQVRVTGKKRDDLQEAIALLKGQDFGIPLQFKNFRD
ncbi:YajQ family cyclic di-GMP-binding protein [Deltaproteobacteria bacterium PRO3]|nr:YajQ family cyclic di-GMP-binding protein [Deltaproteobacteria bacterium PRO3]